MGVNQKRVLVIDDEPEIRRNLSIGLAQKGYECTTCPDGISAIHELDRSKLQGVGYNYLITDIFMPDIDGLKILKVIKKGNPELPVLVITGFGDEALKATALDEANTGYLAKPFDIDKLEEALKKLTPGPTTLDGKDSKTSSQPGSKEIMSAYLTIRITSPEDSNKIYQQLYFMEGISSCEATRGAIDIILLAQGSSKEELQKLFDKVKAISGIEVLSMSPVERPKLDKDINTFLKDYQGLVKDQAVEEGAKDQAVKSYLLIDIEPEKIQEIFTTVYCVDEVIFCDVIENGTKLVGMVYDNGTSQSSAKIIEKLSHIDGILRVRKAEIIKMMDM